MSSSRSSLNQRLAFTLPELLVAVVIGSIVLLAASQILISHIRSSSRMEALMRLQDNWSRLQFLLNHEIQEARGASISGGSLILRIPNPASPQSLTDVSYILSDGTLLRSGPAIASDGSLNFSQSASNQVVLRGVTTFTAALTSGGSQEVTFSVSIQDPTGVTLTNRASATTSESRIIN